MKNRLTNLPRQSVEAVDTWRVREAEAGSRTLDWLVSRLRPTSLGRVPATMGETILFGEGSSDLDGRARAALRDSSALLRASRRMGVMIGGFASQTGSRAYAMRLGLRRVQAIHGFLAWQGIDPDRIAVAIRGTDWLMVERPSRAADAEIPRGEYRLRIADPQWVLSSN